MRGLALFCYKLRPCSSLYKHTQVYYTTHNDIHITANSGTTLYKLTEEEKLMKETVAKFAHDVIRPHVSTMDADARMHPDVLRGLYDAGIMSIEIPEQYGGVGSSFFSAVLAIEEIAKVCMSVAAYVDEHNIMIVNALLNWATKEQKEHYYPRMCNYQLPSFCLSEPTSGSDAFALRTSARKDGEWWYIEGNKHWITAATEPGFMLVMANAAPEKGYRGVTCFLVEKDAPGVDIARPEDKMGIRSAATCPIHFDNVKVHESAILGQVGDGYRIIASTLNEGRIGIAALTTGAAEGAFRAAVEYTMERQQFGRKIFSFQGMQHQIAHARAQIEASRLMTYNAARMKEAGLPIRKEAAMAKYFASEAAVQVSAKAVDWMGGVGYTKNYPVEKFYRDIKIGTTGEGTSNIQLNTIATCLEQEGF